MHLPISLCLIKPSLWIITSGRKRIARGSLAATRPTLISLTRGIILLREVEATVPIAMEVTSIGEMATTIMANKTNGNHRNNNSGVNRNGHNNGHRNGHPNGNNGQ